LSSSACFDVHKDNHASARTYFVLLLIQLLQLHVVHGGEFELLENYEIQSAIYYQDASEFV
jgi:hypothetical protein